MLVSRGKFHVLTLPSEQKPTLRVEGEPQICDFVVEVVLSLISFTIFAIPKSSGDAVRYSAPN
jgi:hypothetical protein